jgi:hypothetical protein
MAVDCKVCGRDRTQIHSREAVDEARAIGRLQGLEEAAKAINDDLTTAVELSAPNARGNHVEALCARWQRIIRLLAQPAPKPAGCTGLNHPRLGYSCADPNCPVHAKEVDGG